MVVLLRESRNSEVAGSLWHPHPGQRAERLESQIVRPLKPQYTDFPHGSLWRPLTSGKGWYTTERRDAAKEGVMPKEAVYGRMHPDPAGSGECDPDEQPIVEVRWHRESETVQVVTRLRGAEIPSLEESENIPVRYGLYVEVDRHEINALIRNLRRARDQAFGRDE